MVNLSNRGHTPLFLRFVKLLSPLISAKVQDIAVLLATKVENSEMGISFFKVIFKVEKYLPTPNFMSKGTHVEKVAKLDKNIVDRWQVKMKTSSQTAPARISN